MSDKTYSYRLPYSFCRRHSCSYCGAVYEYLTSGELSGTSSGSEAEARVEAEKALTKIRERTALDKPCPNCGRYSSEALACFSVGDADGTIMAPGLGGLAAAFASTLLLTADVNPLTVLLAFATCGAIAFLAVGSWNRLKRMNASPGENLAAMANNVELRSDLIDIRTNLACGREVDKSTFQWLEYFRLARLVFPAFAVLYFFGRALGAIEGAFEIESLKQFWFAMIGTVVALTVLEGRAGSEEKRFQGKKPLALDGSGKENAAESESFERKGGDGETLDETAAVEESFAEETRDDAETADAEVALQPVLDDEQIDAIERAFAIFAERDATPEAETFAPNVDDSPNLEAEPTNPIAPFAAGKIPVETETVERERVERERVERERVERERDERERDAEERKECERLAKYDASPSRLSKYDR